MTTVVVPVWDAYAGSLLREALESVRAQDVRARIVVVDNASTVPIEADPDIELVRAPTRLALGAARNLGIERVRTPFVLVWDADDVMLPGTLRALEGAMTRDSRLVACGAAILDDVDGPRHRWPRRWAAPVMARPRLFAALDAVWSMYPTVGATIMRVDLVRDAGGYAPTEGGEDWVLGVSLALRGRLGWTERPGRLYRRHAGSVSGRHDKPVNFRIHARAVRARMRTDPATPGWLRALLPLIAVAQTLAIVASSVKRFSRRRGAP
jgi:glycosyltransferase involved in cell wall biosynthesis